MPTDEQDLCPYPGHDTVVCPACREEIRGVVPDGTAAEPEARCPECDAVITTVIVTD